MAPPRLAATALAGAAALLALVSLMTPWWTASYDVSGAGSGDRSARPFDDNGIVDSGDAVAAGLVMVFAIVAAGLGLVGTVVRTDLGRMLSFIGLGLCAVLSALAPLLAVTTWPAEDAGFWESSSTSGFLGGSSSAETYASVGWYLALGGAVAALAALVAALTAPKGTTATKPTTN